MPTVPSRVSSPLDPGADCYGSSSRAPGASSSPTTPPVWATSSGWRPPVGSVTGCAWGGPHRDRARTLARHGGRVTRPAAPTSSWPRTPVASGLTGHRRCRSGGGRPLGPDQVHVMQQSRPPGVAALRRPGQGVDLAETELNWDGPPGHRFLPGPRHGAHLERRHRGAQCGRPVHPDASGSRR